MEERKIPDTLEEAYRLRDGAGEMEEWDFYQEHVYRLRREEYRARGIRTEISSRRRERQSAIEFSREMFFLEVSEISAEQHSGREVRVAQQEARRYATRLDTHAFLKQLASPHSGAVDLYRRNYLELLRMGKPAAEAYYLSRVIGLAGDEEFRRCIDSVQVSGHPRGRLAVPRRENGHTNPGPSRRHDPDPANVLRLALRLCVGNRGLGRRRGSRHHLFRLSRPRRRGSPYAGFGRIYSYLYPVYKQVARNK